MDPTGKLKLWLWDVSEMTCSAFPLFHLFTESVAVTSPLLDSEAVWLVWREDQKSPMAKAFLELLARKVESIT